MDDVPDEKTKKITKKQSRFKQALSGFNKRYIDDAVKFYLDRNVDPIIISGIFGNISQESGWNPLANSKENGLGDFYGLVQMSPNMRKEVKRVYGKVDANTTHQFIYDAMTGNKKISEPWRRYMTEKGGYWNNKYHDAGTAAMAFGNVFERPSERYANWDERMRSASDAYDYVMQIVNAKDEANKKSFANPIKTTVAADGNKVMTVNPEYWEQQGLLQPVQKPQIEQPVQQSTPIRPKRIQPIDVSPAPWDQNQQVLNRGIEVIPRKSPFSLSLSLPSLDNLLQINSSEEQAKQYFADVLGISDIRPEMVSLLRAKDGKLPGYKWGLSPMNVWSTLKGWGKYLRNRMYNTVQPSGYNMDNVKRFVKGTKRTSFQDPNTEAAFGKYTEQDSIYTQQYDDFLKKKGVPRRVLSKKEYQTMTGSNPDDEGMFYQPISKVAVDDLLVPSKSVEGSYEFKYPNLPGQYPLVPKGEFGDSKWLHSHSLGGYEKGTKKDSDGVYDYYTDTWDINPFKGQSSSDDGSTLFKLGNAIGLGYFDDIIPWGNPIKIDGKLYQKDNNADMRNTADKWQLIGSYKDGKSPIRIKAANRGKLTRLKKRTGKSESELYNDGNPAHKKMVVFARNARKWKH